MLVKLRVNNSGQALVETLAAIAIAAIVIVALLNLGVSSIRGAGSSKNEVEALRLANEELELVRNFRDNQGFYELVSFNNNCGSISSRCSVDSSGGFINTSPETIGIFERHFYMTYFEGEGNVEIFITTSWTEAGRGKKVQTATKFSEWYKKSN